MNLIQDSGKLLNEILIDQLLFQLSYATIKNFPLYGSREQLGHIGIHSKLKLIKIV